MKHPKNSLSKSESLYRRAQQTIPGGVSRNTVIRHPYPNYARAGQGALVTDVDGVTRIDFANNMASLIHGHCCPEVVASVTQQLQKGTAFTLATEAELELAEHLTQRVPWIDKIRFTNSGTEAVMASIKTARAITGRPKIAKCEGTYHGTYDYAEVSQNAMPEHWGEAQRPASLPVAHGTPQSVLDDVVVIPFNDLEMTLQRLDQEKDRLSAVLIDLVPQRIGLCPATQEYVVGLREWTKDHGVLLIVDEVISFRMTVSGAMAWYPIEPDLVTLGKIIGGGFPVGALGGKDGFMEVLDPACANFKFPFSGTFSANPVTMTAGLTALQKFDAEAVQQINELGDYARQAISEAFAESQVACVSGQGSMFRVHLTREPPFQFRQSWLNLETQQRLQRLVNELYQAGFMTFRTCTCALSTASEKQHVDDFVECLKKSILQS